jgi:hypothetical protein
MFFSVINDMSKFDQYLLAYTIIITGIVLCYEGWFVIRKNVLLKEVRNGKGYRSGCLGEHFSGVL